MPRRRDRHRPQDDPSLDLHGLTADQARHRTRAWLRERRAGGDAAVVVVTGRGLHSTAGPVLPGEIEALLQELRGGLVEDFVSIAGRGAFRVYLSSPPVRRRSRPSPPLDGPRADPELYLRAEESLRDLGVDPTPALVEAEMRRMRQEPEP